MRVKLLFALLGVAVLALVALRGCNTNEVVIEDSAETLEMKQMMNDIVQQQERGAGGP